MGRRGVGGILVLELDLSSRTGLIDPAQSEASVASTVLYYYDSDENSE